MYQSQFRYIGIFIPPLKNVTPQLYFTLFSYNFDIIKNNLICSFFTYITTKYIYSSMTPFCYMYPYFTFSSGSPSPFSSTQTSGLPFLLVHSKFISILQHTALYITMQGQEPLRRTHSDRPSIMRIQICTFKKLPANFIKYCTICCSMQQWATAWLSTTMHQFHQNQNS